MTTPKFTPGPWVAEIEDGFPGDVMGADGTHVVCLGHDYDDGGIIHSEEDALLIAAAPDLFNAVEELLRTGLNGGNNVRLAFIGVGGQPLTPELLEKADASERAVEAARKALAKARGAKAEGR